MMSVMKEKREKKEKMEGSGYLLWGLIAVELFMSFSFLGYVHIEPISLTFVYIPVLIAGCILGPKEAALVGAVFGMASMWKASAYYVSAGDSIFSPTTGGKPLESILLSVGARTLFGYTTGALYCLAKKCKRPLVGIAIVSAIGKFIHSFWVYAFMGILFPEEGYAVKNVLDGALEKESLLLILIVDTVVLLCYVFVNSDAVKDFLRRIQTFDRAHAGNRRSRSWLGILFLVTIIASSNVMVYFTNRIERMLHQYGIYLSERVSHDLMHLQIQFLLGMMAMEFLAIIGIILYQKNFNYLYYKARMDGLTGLHGRRQFFQIGEKVLKDMDQNRKERFGCFVILDIDEFKEINDEFGHPEGDRVLKEVADSLKRAFDDRCLLGRLGGDEFVALVYRPMERKEIDKILGRFKENVSRIQIQDKNVTCSLGVIPLERDRTLDELYRSADRLLYEAKKNGKNQTVYGCRFRDTESGK